MLEWINLVWKPATEGKRALLFQDSFSAHVTNAVKKRFKEINTVPIIIPVGYTSKIQSLNVSPNKPFKAFARTHWSDYIMTQADRQQKNQPNHVPLPEVRTSEIAFWNNYVCEHSKYNAEVALCNFVVP